MEEINNDKLENKYKLQKILRRRIEIDEEQIAMGFPSVHIRLDLEEARQKLDEVQKEIDDLERMQRYSVSDISHLHERGELNYKQAVELMEEREELETSESLDQYRIEELRTYAMSSLKLAIRNGYISAELFFLLGKIYDLRGNINEAFEYYTASIISDEKNRAAYEARITLCESLLELQDAQANLIRLCLDKDRRMLQAISDRHRKEKYE